MINAFFFFDIHNFYIKPIKTCHLNLFRIRHPTPPCFWTGACCAAWSPCKSTSSPCLSAFPRGCQSERTSRSSSPLRSSSQASPLPLLLLCFRQTLLVFRDTNTVVTSCFQTGVTNEKNVQTIRGLQIRICC